MEVDPGLILWAFIVVLAACMGILIAIGIEHHIQKIRDRAYLKRLKVQEDNDLQRRCMINFICYLQLCYSYSYKKKNGYLYNSTYSNRAVYGKLHD